MPETRITSTIPTETSTIALGAPLPRIAQRKPSITPAIGLSPYQTRSDSGTRLEAYTTGDANIQIWMRKGIVYWKSRYLTLSAESQRPTPRDVASARRRKNGRKMMLIVGAYP